MGVRGLTSYVARNAEHYLKPFELHDTNLVIDGDNLACNLYKDVSGIYSAFGGDYDDYYRGVVRFFALLSECHIRPFVLMDGGYQSRKMFTVTQRMRNKIALIKRINPAGSVTIFPLMLKEVFIDALHDLGIPVMRCVFEADDELAALSRALKCPVLSFDSDFYIHDVSYIPLVTLTLKAHTKFLPSTDIDDEGCEEKQNRSLRKCEVKKFEKRTRNHTILTPITLNNCEKRKKMSKSDNRGSYKYLDCCIYRNKHFMSKGSLSAEKLPLLASMLGNDYISRSSFRNFYMYGLGKLGRCTKTKQQQRRIRKVIKWLQHETTETALEKILNKIPKKQRPSIRKKVCAAMNAYSIEECYSYEYFRENYPEIIASVERAINASGEEISDTEEELSDDEEYEISDEDDISIDEDEILKSFNSERIVEEGSGTEVEEQDDSCNEEGEVSIDSEDFSSAELDEFSSDKCNLIDSTYKRYPKWFLKKIHSAQFPRFYVDLVHLRKYINNPIIEHFPYPECNQIALPILCHIFTILQRCKGEQFPRRGGRQISAEEKPHFTYLTRKINQSNVHYVRYEMNDVDNDFIYDPEQPDIELLKMVFRNRTPQLNCNHLFEEALPQLPQDLQLYFLAIVYWLQKSKYSNLEHLHALIICLIVLRTIDTKITPERNLQAFAKRYGKIINREKMMRASETRIQQNHGETEVEEESIEKELPAEQSIIERIRSIPKSDCYLVQNELLKHFHMPEIFKKKYDLYSSIVLHAYSEFQSVLYQLYALNALLEYPYESSRLSQLYCGVFLYNLYNLVNGRQDTRYYVKTYIFRDSKLMFEFYEFLWNWCQPFIPSWKCARTETMTIANERLIVLNTNKTPANRNILRKRRHKTRRELLKEKQQQKATKEPEEISAEIVGENEDTLVDADKEGFFDINNKFSSLLRI